MRPRTAKTPPSTDMAVGIKGRGAKIIVYLLRQNVGPEAIAQRLAGCCMEGWASSSRAATCKPGGRKEASHHYLS